MKKLLSIIGWSLSSAACFPATAQTADTTGPAATAPATQPASNASSPTIVRDPRTGLLYQQETQTVDQPVTTWQRKVVKQTVVTPQTIVENQQVPQTVYVAKTEYVLQSKIKGLWNPFAQPTYAYEYVPVTRWVPQTQMITRQVPTVKMIARTEDVPIDEPVQTTQKVTQVVLKPLPASTAVATNTWPAGAVVTTPQAYATQRSYANTAWTNASPSAAFVPASQVAYQTPANNYRPLIASVPVLSQGRPLNSFQPGTLLTAPVSGLRSIVRTATAPFNSQVGYAAPTNIATLPSTSARDLNQVGMPATILR